MGFARTQCVGCWSQITTHHERFFRTQTPLAGSPKPIQYFHRPCRPVALVRLRELLNIMSRELTQLSLVETWVITFEYTVAWINAVKSSGNLGYARTQCVHSWSQTTTHQEWFLRTFTSLAGAPKPIQYFQCPCRPVALVQLPLSFQPCCTSSCPSHSQSFLAPLAHQLCICRLQPTCASQHLCIFLIYFYISSLF